MKRADKRKGENAAWRGAEVGGEDEEESHLGRRERTRRGRENKKNSFIKPSPTVTYSPIKTLKMVQQNLLSASPRFAPSARSLNSFHSRRITYYCL